MPDRYLGRTIGKYRVTRLLGTGAFSWVYEAVDQDLEIPVALKVLRPEFAGQETAEVRFRREASTAAKLRHPNIVTVRDVGLVDGAAFVAMDLYPLTLGRRLALLGRLPEAECVRLGIGVAAALAVAHASQVIHRDIKPDNILLDETGDAIVADFGLARALATGASESVTGQVQGTPHYFSPEQARGQELDGRSDLYSLGVTLYRAATGRLPFEGDDWYAVARQHIEAPPPSPRALVPELTPEFEAVILRLLSKEPGARPTNAVAVVDALAALPTAPDHSAAIQRLGSHTLDAFRPMPMRRVRGAVVGAGVIAAALLAWITWGAPERPTAPPSGTSADSAPVFDSLSPLASSAGDSAARTPVPATGATPGPADTADTAPPRRPAPVPRTVRLEIVASEDAEVYVDNRLVGTGRWSGERPVAARLVVRAVIPDAPTTCETSARDTTLTALRAGQRVSLDLPVRGCAVVSYRVQPRDARVAFIALDGGRSLETRADSAISVSLPTGRYLMRITAPRCASFTDTVQVRAGAPAAAIPRSLFCG